MLICATSALTMHAGEIVFANYFDIPFGSPAGTEVTGKIHLQRNKDVHTNPVPGSYAFGIIHQSSGDFFDITTEFDSVGRITGVLSVRKGAILPDKPQKYPVTVVLKDGNKTIEEFTVEINAVEQTLWSKFYERYVPETLRQPRLYGRKKLTDDEVARYIAALEAGCGRFPDEISYTTHPGDYVTLNKNGETIEYGWTRIAEHIGQLGYAYATSAVYGPDGDSVRHSQLRDVLVDAIIAYTNCVPVEGDDVLVDGKPIGPYTGDGTSMLQQYRWAGHQVLTHQWTLTDPLVVPVLQLMPDIIEGMKRGDGKARTFYDSMVRYFQIFTAIVKNRRAIDNPDERWQEIQNPNYSSGAWADANLGHRSRTMLALPIIWADYNRPMTYVPYWYDDFYPVKPYDNFSYAHGWSPHGVVADVAHWMTRNNIPSHRYAQSGFHPDGTISHHIGHGTDAAMVAYGFEWLTGFNTGFQFFKGTPFEIPGKHLQFELDRLLDIYPVLIYKGAMDNLVAGRSFLEDMGKFGRKTYPNAVSSLMKATSRRSGLQRADELRAMANRIRAGSHEMTATVPYWVNEYLVHRRGTETGGKPFFASVKLKSKRTVGAEDFDKKVRHSWHMGYGILQLKVRGDEYSRPVLAGFDWHALPGLTEEWRTDPLPTAGGAQASLPGANKVAGVLADSLCGMAIYHHLPQETYSSAQAFKTYHFNDSVIFALGSGISRRHPGQGKDIATFIDQGALIGPLTICADGRTTVIKPDESRRLDIKSTAPVWLHCGEKGYVVFPADGPVTLSILSGSEINVTDPGINVKGRKPGFIIALNHGSNPHGSMYAYAMIANASVRQMPDLTQRLAKDYSFARIPSKAHALRAADGTMQFAFFAPGEIKLGGVTVRASDASQLILRPTTYGGYVLSASNPAPDDSKTALTFTTSLPLTPGSYPYTAGGIYPIEGETVTVTPEDEGSRITVELPDRRDETKYNYQTELYSGVPVVVSIPAKK